jgi:L-alanine-DL-glutamate epimerase-like enolase superfamily enzyme
VVKISAVAVDVVRVPVDPSYRAGGHILRAMPRIENGELVAPAAPGLGLALDEAAVRRYRVA